MQTGSLWKQRVVLGMVLVGSAVGLAGLAMSCRYDSSASRTGEKCVFSPEEVDSQVEEKLGSDEISPADFLTDDERMMVGNWFGKSSSLHSNIWLQLRADGTYQYESWLGIGKFHNVDRVSRYEGTLGMGRTPPSDPFIGGKKAFAVLARRFGSGAASHEQPVRAVHLG